MSELVLSDGQNETVLPETAEEKARQVPDPVTYHLLCVLPKAEQSYESGLLKAGQTMHFEEVLSPVLFVMKMGPDCYKDPIRPDHQRRQRRSGHSRPAWRAEGLTMALDNEEFKFPDEVQVNTKEEKVDFEIENNDAEVEVVDDTPEADRGRAPMKEPPAEVTDDELAKYSEGVKQRIQHFSKGYHEERPRISWRRTRSCRAPWAKGSKRCWSRPSKRHLPK